MKEYFESVVAVMLELQRFVESERELEPLRRLVGELLRQAQSYASGDTRVVFKPDEPPTLQSRALTHRILQITDGLPEVQNGLPARSPERVFAGLLGCLWGALDPRFVPSLRAMYFVRGEDAPVGDVALRIQAVGRDPQEFSELLGVQPTACWPVHHDSPALWLLESPLAQTDSLEDQLQALLEVLPPPGDVWRRLSEGASAEITCELRPDGRLRQASLSAKSVDAVAERFLGLHYDVHVQERAAQEVMAWVAERRQYFDRLFQRAEDEDWLQGQKLKIAKKPKPPVS